MAAEKGVDILSEDGELIPEGGMLILQDKHVLCFSTGVYKTEV